LLTESDLNTNFLSNNWISSIERLFQLTNYNLETLIRGDVSFGAMLEINSLNAIPSPYDRKPNKTNYFNGGYLANHLSGFSDSKSILNVIQCELPTSMRATQAKYSRSAKLFARAVVDFYNLHSFNK
jgi:hypothetical protein